MHFFTLVPKLIDESSHVGLMISERLVEIYKRSFEPQIKANLLSIYTFDDVPTGRLNQQNLIFSLLLVQFVSIVLLISLNTVNPSHCLFPPVIVMIS